MDDGVDVMVAQDRRDGRVAGVGADELETADAGDGIGAAMVPVDRLERAQVAADDLGVGNVEARWAASSAGSGRPTPVTST